MLNSPGSGPTAEPGLHGSGLRDHRLTRTRDYRGQSHQLRAIGAKAGELVLNILGGTKVLEISRPSWTYLPFPCSTGDNSGAGNLSENALPKGSIVINKELTLWDFRFHIIGALAFVMAQSGLIAGLVVNLGKRRRAEKAVAASEARYRTVADYTYDWEYWSAPDGSLKYVSPSCERITGYSPQEFIDNPSLRHEIIIPEDRQIWDRHKADFRTRIRVAGNPLPHPHP